MTNDTPQKQMDLVEQIKERSKEFKTDNYPMSIGEIINLYNNGEIIINPDFQRYYRWEIAQKSRFIESILLGIPIPSIFVYQREDGIWELVDGLQRISTILEFTGNLKDKEGKNIKQLKLVATKLLPHLNDLVWEKKEDQDHALSKPLQLDFKRSKIKIEIIQKESDPTAKFEVFDRLNTGGAFLSDQEVRNSLLVMTNKKFYEWLEGLTMNSDFQNCVPIAERLIKERYDMELILKYLSLSYFSLDGRDVSQMLNDSMSSFSNNPDFDYDGEKEKFDKLFRLLNLATGEDSFKKYVGSKFSGRFLESGFEPVTIGLRSNLDQYDDSDSGLIREKIIGMWAVEDFTGRTGSGSNAKVRIPRVVEFGKKYFNKNG